MKVYIALLSMSFLLGCAARPHIQCTAKDGSSIYHGPYDHESGGEFIVQENDLTRTYYRKTACHKVPPPTTP